MTDWVDRDQREFLDVVRKRRTARSYSPHPVPDEWIGWILEAARWAPSAANSQPWEFIVIDDPDCKAILKKLFLDEALQHQDSHYGSVTQKQAELLDNPVLIAVCGDPGSQDTYIDSPEIPEACRHELFQLTMGATIQNMLLAATRLGLGSTWIARLARVPGVAELLEVPAHLRIISFVAVGYGDREPYFSESLRRPIDEKTHHNRYSGDPDRTGAESR